MRVPNLSTYSTSTYQLGGLTSNLQDANEVMATQKRINNIYDDPVGMTQVLDMKTTLGNLDQIEKNVNMGKSWLTGVETSLDSVNSLILDAKTEVSRLINDSASADERKDAVERIDGILEQIVALGNTQVNGNYIFGGTDTDYKPFVYHGEEDPQYVSYEGNSIPFEIRTDRETGVKVGRDGQKTFWDDMVTINQSNNTIVFKEDNGHGSVSERVLTAVIPEGEYTEKELELEVRNALNEVSSSNGYGVTYEVAYDGDDNRFSIRTDGSFDGYIRTEFLWKTGGEAYVNEINTSSNIDPDGVDLHILNKDALTIGTPLPHGSDPLRLTWDGVDSWIVDGNPGYVMPSKIPGSADRVEIDFNESGFPDITLGFDHKVAKGEFVTFEVVPKQGDCSLGHEIGFNGGDTIQEPSVSDNEAVFVTDLVFQDGVNDQIVFEEVDSAGVATPLTIDLNTTGADVTYTDMGALAAKIESDMEAASALGPNSIDYSVSYDSDTSRFQIREKGTELDELHLRWSASSAASTLGFYSSDDSTVYPASDVGLDRTIVLDDLNNSFSFQETDPGGTPSSVLTATVAPGTYRNSTDIANAVQASLNAATVNAATYAVGFNPATNAFTISDTSGNISNFDLLWESGNQDSGYLAGTLGFYPVADITGGVSHTSNSDPVIMSFDSTNNRIDFSETDADGNILKAHMEIPEGDYTSPDHLAALIQTGMRDASWNNVDYTVTYDAAEEEFIFKEGGTADISSFSLLWYSGENAYKSAGDMLGFDTTSDDEVRFPRSDEGVVNININSFNNKLDFKEITAENQGMAVEGLTATIKEKIYTSHAQLAGEIEKALETESLAKGNRINYAVSWDAYTKKFSIKEDGSDLEELDLMWQSGKNAPAAQGGSGESIGSLLGFNTEDDISAPTKSVRDVEWGIFNTLIDLKGYLNDNDTHGLERTLGRLDAHYDNMTSRIADTGIKYNRLDVREQITIEANLSLTARRSSIEDVDIIEAIMNLKSIETAYEASLNSTSKIMKMSLVDYL